MKELIEQLGVHEQLGPTGQGWGIEQNAEELAVFVAAMQALGVQTVLELGTGPQAGLARFMTQRLGWSVVSIDRNGPFTPVPGVTLIIADTAEAIDRLDFMEGQKFDLVIIDADHKYQAIKRDYGLYNPLAAKAVMFHDIAGLRACEGVAKFWQEISRVKSGNLRKGCYEAIVEGPQRAGIGWIEK